MKKLFISLLLLSVFTSNSFVYAKENNNIISYKNTIAPRKDKLVWKYKSINGILHKRLWNQSKGKWIGNWIPC